MEQYSSEINIFRSGSAASGKTFATTDSLSVTAGGQTNDINLTTGMSAADLAGQFNATEGVFGVGATTQAAVGNFGLTNTTATDVVTLNVEGVEITATAGATGDATVAALDTAIDAATTEALAAKGITASVVAAGGNANDDLLVFTNSDGDNIDITMEIAGGLTDGLSGTVSAYDGTAVIAGGVTTTAGISTTASNSTTITGRLDVTSAVLDVDFSSLSVTGTGTLNGATTTNAVLDTATSLSSVANLDISTAGGSQSAIDVIDAALATIGDSRADLGAVQNRFSQTIGNLANIQENASASRSRIQDTDYATETAVMTKNQILQQAGTSILAQANQIPQAAISLIGG